MPKTDYSNSSIDWTLVNKNFNVENYGIKLVYNEIDTTLADMSFNDLRRSRSIH